MNCFVAKVYIIPPIMLGSIAGAGATGSVYWLRRLLLSRSSWLQMLHFWRAERLTLTGSMWFLLQSYNPPHQLLQAGSVPQASAFFKRSMTIDPSKSCIVGDLTNRFFQGTENDTAFRRFIIRQGRDKLESRWQERSTTSNDSFNGCTSWCGVLHFFQLRFSCCSDLDDCNTTWQFCQAFLAFTVEFVVVVSICDLITATRWEMASGLPAPSTITVLSLSTVTLAAWPSAFQWSHLSTQDQDLSDADGSTCQK